MNTDIDLWLCHYYSLPGLSFNLHAPSAVLNFVACFSPLTSLQVSGHFSSAMAARAYIASALQSHDLSFDNPGHSEWRILNMESDECDRLSQRDAQRCQASSVAEVRFRCENKKRAHPESPYAYLHADSPSRH